MIDILVPVLSRPQNVRRLHASIATSTEAAHTIHFLCSEDDRAEIYACLALISINREVHVWVLDFPEQGNYARKINWGFAHSVSPFVFQAADDIEFTPGWDTNALAAMTDGIGVVATNDQANRQVMRGEYGTHNLIRRAYILEHGGTFDGTPGVVLHEGYDHWYVDRELCDAAKQRGAYAFAKNSVVKHHHPFFDRSLPTDPTYEKGQARAREDQALYMSRSPLFKRRQPDIIAR